ncbi:hypothetical protein ACWGLF_29695 [Streptomyces puniciscabiei]
MGQRHIFGTVFTLESIVAGGVFLVILGVVAWLLVRRRSDASDRPERPRRDVDGAARAGLATAWLRRTVRLHPPTAHPADLTVTALPDLAAGLGVT